MYVLLSGTTTSPPASSPKNQVNNEFTEGFITPSSSSKSHRRRGRPNGKAKSLEEKLANASKQRALKLAKQHFEKAGYHTMMGNIAGGAASTSGVNGGAPTGMFAIVEPTSANITNGAPRRHVRGCGTRVTIVRAATLRRQKPLMNAGE